jgi:radical SAM protein with 4Fe4S-binding SPASM domain
VNALRWLSRIFLPPSLPLKQLGSALLYTYLIRWRRFPFWLIRNSLKSLPMAAGARGMGCIGFADHPAWEITSRCNLTCLHCHTGHEEKIVPDLTTIEAKKVIDDLRKIPSFRMIAFTGGEPLVRDDLEEILAYSTKKGFFNVIATNGTLITPERARSLKKAGTHGVAVSLDSLESSIHNTIRNAPFALEAALKGIENARKAGIPVQINITAMADNKKSLPDLLRFADSIGAVITLLYQLVPVGRGEKISTSVLDAERNKELLEMAATLQSSLTTIISPVAGPQYWSNLLKKNNMDSKFWRMITRPLFHGCAAGRGFVYIKANGEVWPCPFMEVSAGNLREKSFKDIWETSPVFATLRNREKLLKGKCGDCVFKSHCGGCRGRALAMERDVMAADPSCFLDV